MVSVAALRRLISNAKQAEMAEEMLNDVINARLGLNGYRLAGILPTARTSSGSNTRENPTGLPRKTSQYAMA